MKDSNPMNDVSWKVLDKGLKITDEQIERHMKAVEGMADLFRKWRLENDTKGTDGRF